MSDDVLISVNNKKCFHCGNDFKIAKYYESDDNFYYSCGGSSADHYVRIHIDQDAIKRARYRFNTENGSISIMENYDLENPVTEIFSYNLSEIICKVKNVFLNRLKTKEAVQRSVLSCIHFK